MILQQELPWSLFLFVLGVGNIKYAHYQLFVLHCTAQLPGTSLASVEVSLEKFKSWLQREENRHTAVLMELLL